VLYEPW